MKGIDIVVHGNIGHMSAFMAQSGNSGGLGDAGDALGDSCTRRDCSCGARSKSLGADCMKKRCGAEHLDMSADLLERPASDAKPEEFKRYGSAVNFINFNI